MLLVHAELRTSTIHGLGVFSLSDIDNGVLIRVIDHRTDHIYSAETILSFPPPMQLFLYPQIWKSKWSGMYCMPGGIDTYINHSETPNLSVEHPNSEHILISNKTITIGEELTVNYKDFDSLDFSQSNLWEKMRKLIGNVGQQVFSDGDRFDELFYK